MSDILYENGKQSLSSPLLAVSATRRRDLSLPTNNINGRKMLSIHMRHMPRDLIRYRTRGVAKYFYFPRELWSVRKALIRQRSRAIHLFFLIPVLKCDLRLRRSRLKPINV